MSAKEWLIRARKMRSRLRALQNSKERAFSKATSITVSGGARVSGGAPADTHAAFAEVSLAVDRQIEELEQTRAEILQGIRQLEDNTLSTLLTEYYINDKTWEKIAEEQHYSFRQIMRLHAKALQQIQSIIGQE